jgi:Phasin protein
MGTAQQNPLVNIIQHQLDASMRLADAVFLGKGKIDRVILDATHQAVENNLQIARALTEVQDPSQFKDLQNKLAFHPEKNMHYQQEILSAVAEIQAEMGKSVQNYMERFGQNAAGKLSEGAQTYANKESIHQDNGLFNPMASMFSVWERAFRDVTSLTNKNLATAQKSAENGAYAAANSLSETADSVDAEVHDYEHAERKHSGASKKK